MKVLWVSLRLFSDEEEKQTAVWLKSLAIKIAESDNLILGNISSSGKNGKVVQCDYGKIRQWAVPVKKIRSSGYPDKDTTNAFYKVVCEFDPDIVQVWGSENPFRLLPFDSGLPGVKVLTMQGVMSSIHPVLFQGLTFLEILSTIGIRELIKRRSLFTVKKSFVKISRFEETMIKKSQYIITQSEWTDSQIRSVNSSAVSFKTHRVLREEFYSAPRWNEFEHSRPVLYSAAIGYSLKGLHVLIKALALVKHEFPDVELRLAGATGRRDFLGDGYLRYILRLAKTLQVSDNIVWLGAVSANEIIENLQQASVFINPSFVESYSMVVAEAMAIGTPSVISFAGAMPELAVNNVEALYFTPADYHQLAYHIVKLLVDKQLSDRISLAAQQRAESRLKDFDTVKNQMGIYNSIYKQ